MRVSFNEVDFLEDSYHHRTLIGRNLVDEEEEVKASSTSIDRDSITITTYRQCSSEYFASYINSGQDVLDAIHAKLVVDDDEEEEEDDDTNVDKPRSQLPRTWTECTNRINYSNEDVMTPVIDLYRKLLVGDDEYQASIISSNMRKRKHNRRHHNHNNKPKEQARKTNSDDGNDGIRMMIYSGDDDSVCSLAGTQTWIWDLLGDEPSASGPDDKIWQPWKLNDNGQIAGYVTQFDMVPYYSSHVGIDFPFLADSRLSPLCIPFLSS